MIVDVTSDDIDRLGHVNNSIYLRWIEQAVHAHWMAHADAIEAASFEWIAVRHEIDYRKATFAGDRVVIDVRIESVRRARAWYRSIVTRDGDLIAEALSCWCCIDAVTHRLTVIPGSATDRFLHADRGSIAS